MARATLDKGWSSHLTKMAKLLDAERDGKAKPKRVVKRKKTK